MDAHTIHQLELEVLELKDLDKTGLPSNYVKYSEAYVGFHSRRIATLLHTLSQLGASSESRIMDIGPTFTAQVLHKHFDCQVDSISFSEDQWTPFGRNIQFDLNDAQDPAKWRKDVSPYPFVVMAEVLEHLYVAPTLALRYIKNLLAPGGVAIIQTPNALAFKQRIQMLLGRHPFEPISEDPKSPNHFRENTMDELVSFAHQAGLEVLDAKYHNYFNPSYRQTEGIQPWMGALYFRFCDFLPSKLKRGLMVVCRNNR
jgi:hypothetical protein